MAEEHWFDTLGRTLARGMPRRGVLRSAPLVAAGWLLGGVAVAEAAKPKGKSKNKNSKKKTGKNGKGKGKAKPKGKQSSCGADACAEFATQEDRDYCEFICRQCDGSDPREFCIVEGDPSDPAKVAVCCDRGEECCAGEDGSECCGPPSTCCSGVGCISEELTCCPDDSALGACYAGDTCCPGVGCVNTSIDRSHCGRCGNACPSDESCTDGACLPDWVCPARTVPCGNSTFSQPDDCCAIAACFGCEAVSDPSNPGGSRSQCVYQCVGDQVCVDDGRFGLCCLPAGSACNPGNVGRGFCCSGQCVRDEVSGGNRCL
jgi:hypothetical protein